MDISPLEDPIELGSGRCPEDAKIARLYIDVERAFGQTIGCFDIFNVIPLSLAGFANQLWTICCILTNFFGPLVAEKK